jgi:hypothetical protein
MPTPSSPHLDPEAKAEALRAFIATHAQPVDPSTDDYECPPFAADIKEGKTESNYAVHQYHTKVPPRGIVPYILHYTKPGDLILDPFCGSGMTAVAARMCCDPPIDILEQFPDLRHKAGSRNIVLNDLSPAACHIAHNYTESVDPTALQRAFDRVMASVQADLHWLYSTEHYEPAVGLYDPMQADVASRLVNPPDNAPTALLTQITPTWQRISKADLESRLGYPVTELPRGTDWPHVDASAIQHWIVIPAQAQYTIWSDVYQCQGLVTFEEPTGKVSRRGANAGKPIMRKTRVARGCGAEIVLWHSAVDSTTGEVSDIISCPHCDQKWKKTSIRRCGLVPVVSNYSYVGLKTTKTGVQIANHRSERPISAKERKHIADISAADIPYWHPNQSIDPKGPQYRRNALQARSIKTVRDFYSKRNLRALAALWAGAEECAEGSIRSRLQFAVTAICYAMSRMYVYRSSRKGGVMNASLYFPSLIQEMNVETAFRSKWRQILEAATFDRGVTTHSVVVCGSAERIDVPDNVVDYIFTDPPFGSNIYYSEASVIWECWLDRFTDRKAEAVVHRKNDGGFKRIDDYQQTMSRAFAEMYRVLKPGRWATVEFNNSDGAVFEAVKRAIREAGFDIVNMLLLDKEQKTFKQSKGASGEEDVVDKDVLFNLQKPAIVGTSIKTEDHDLEEQVATAVRQHLQSLPDRIKADPTTYNEEHRTAATINSMLMNSLIPKGVSVERLNLPFIERVCSRYFRKIGQRWYLRGESVGSGNGRSLIEEEVSVRDEITAIDWLRQNLQKGSMLIGELKPLWMRATGLLPARVSEELALENLLSENFWRDPETNRWREPTDEERERMNDDRSIRVLHDAERYIAGSLHRNTTEAERCEWIDVLFKACRQVEDGDTHSVPAIRGFDAGEGYRLIARLFQGVLREKVPADLFARSQKQAGAASNRISQGVRAEDAVRKAEAVKSKGPSLFDEGN